MVSVIDNNKVALKDMFAMLFSTSGQDGSVLLDWGWGWALVADCCRCYCVPVTQSLQMEQQRLTTREKKQRSHQKQHHGNNLVFR